MKFVVCEHFFNVHTQKQRGKKMAVGRGASSHGTTGTMVNLALFTALKGHKNGYQMPYKAMGFHYSLQKRRRYL